MCNVYMATSGVPYAPPTENFPIFISRVFLPNTNVLTFDEAKKYFITFPVAQGAVDLLDVSVGGLLTVADDIIASYDIVLTNLSPAGGIVFSDGTRQDTAGGGGGSSPPFALDIEVNDINVGRGGVSSGATVPNTNTALGYQVCSSLTLGSDNTNIGNIASNSLTTGDGNVSVGSGSAINLVGGNHNVSVGFNTTSSVVSGSSNTALGYSASQSGDWSNTTCLGALSYATGDNAVAIGFQATAGEHEIVLGTIDETVICRNTLSVVGLITSATPATITNDTTVATTAFVKSSLIPYAPLASPIFTGNPQAPTPTAGDSDTSIATTEFVATALTLYAPLSSPALTGNPTAPTPTAGDSDTSIATTEFVATALTLYAPLSSPALTGNPTAPTPTAGDSDTSIATTAFVATALAGAGIGSGQGTTVSGFFVPPVPPVGLFPPLVSGDIYSTSVVLTSGIWVLTYNTTLIVGSSVSQIQLLVYYSSGSVQPLPINAGQTNIGQFCQTFSSIPQQSGSSQPFTVGGGDTINIVTTTTIYGNFQSYFTGSAPALFIGAVNLKAIKIF